MIQSKANKIIFYFVDTIIPGGMNGPYDYCYSDILL